MDTAKLAIVLKGYPRLSETFIAQEILALQRRGVSICLVSLRHPSSTEKHPIHDEIKAPINYLPEYLADDPLRVIKAWWAMRKTPSYHLAVKVLIHDLRRDFSASRLRRFGQALVMAWEMPSSVTHYYAHFMHTPASVTYYASLLQQKPWSISAHAKDIWTIDAWEKQQKLSSCQWLVTCTAANAEHLRSFADDQDKVELLYHGLDFARFPKPDNTSGSADGSDVAQPVQLISVGRAVDKKGFDLLLDALASLPAALNWHFTHIGNGELLSALKKQAQRLGIDDRISWRGALAQTEVLANYRQADLFVLPSRISADGDRDGLPNVLMEAQSQRLACLSTDISGIPELIEHGVSGWLVPQQNIEMLSSALQRLIAAPGLRAQLADVGYQRVNTHFSLHRGIEQLIDRLRPTVEIAENGA